MKRTQSDTSTIKRLLCLVLVIGMAVMLSSVVACGDDDLDSDPEDPDDVDQNGLDFERDEGDADEDVPDFSHHTGSMHGARCNVMMDCCDPQELYDEFDVTFEDAGECQEQRAFGSGVPGLESFAFEDTYKDGRIDFDEAMAELCAQSLANLSCSEFDGSDEQRDRLPGCSEMIIPQQEVGEECNVNFECISGVCRHESAQGECYEPVDIGEECDDFECGPDAYCELFRNECRELRPAGVDCSLDDQCESNHCAEDDDGDRVCQEKPPVCG